MTGLISDGSTYSFRRGFAQNTGTSLYQYSRPDANSSPPDETLKGVYAVVWTPRNDLPIGPFIAINGDSRIILLDAQSRARAAEKEFDIEPDEKEIMQYIAQFSSANPFDVYSAARTAGARRLDWGSTFLSITEDQRRIVEDAYRGIVKFVRAEDGWDDPLFLGKLPKTRVEVVENYW